jgi:HK97 family phage major capsid protein
MTLDTSAGNRAFLPSEAGPLIVQPVLSISIAAQVANVVTTSAHEFRVPIVADDPTAEWTPEGEEITPSDAALDEAEVAFRKLAGLSIITRELAEDSNPAAAQVVGQGLARDIARKLDVAFFGATGGDPQPEGLEDLIGVTPVAAAGFANVDPFLEAMAEAEQIGATLSAWVTDPATALALAQVKETTDSNRPLLQPDPTRPTRRIVEGLPLYISPAVTEGTVWGIPKDRTFLVLRDNTRLEVDRSAYFSSDRVGVKATMRAGFAFAHPAAIIKVSDTGS